MARARLYESICMAARIFLYLIAIVIVLFLLAGVVWTLFQDELLEMALVPGETIEILAEVEDAAYANQAMWLIRPDIENPPSDWLPEGYGEEVDVDEIADGEVVEEAAENAAPAREPIVVGEDQPRIPVFYVLPTTYLDRDRWNAPPNSPAARPRQELFAASQASVFNEIGEVWAPLYRQAVIGAFLTDHRNAEVALRFAYQDVEAAFDYFLSQIGEDQPFILAGHSQGGLHLATLLHERIAGTPLVGRIAAAYVIGWPISVEADLPALPLPACAEPESSNCIIAFQSFAEPADPRQITRIYDESIGYTGESRRDTAMLCVNPLTGSAGGEASADANLGAIVPNDDMNDAQLTPGLIPARCDEQGLLLVGQPPEAFGRYVLPGNNYHVFDFLLFWSNLRYDVAHRVSAYRAAAE
jgi:pimeloyl-ACP methyl ester carboxylesterase